MIWYFNQIIVESFGYLHDSPPTAHLTLDLRSLLRDPLETKLRQLTGFDRRIQQHVMTTPGARALVTYSIPLVVELARSPRIGESHTRVAVGCGGGRHRSVVIATELAIGLMAVGANVTAKHRDVDKPVVKLR